MPKIRYIGDLRKTIAKALANGGRQHSLFHYSWNVAGKCTNSVTVELYAREYADMAPLKPRKAAMLTLETKCRKCKQCLRERQSLWAWRGVEEWQMSSRSWMGSLTWHPDRLFVLVSMTRLRLARGGTDYDTLSKEEQFEELHKTAGAELTLFLKRLRKLSNAPLRYLLVTELHKSGVPHHHMLLHEVSPEKPVRKAFLEDLWTHNGFSHWRLVTDKRAAIYVTKYLNKAKLARVRASLRYGEGGAVGPLTQRPLAVANEVVA